jgi:HEAT repeat protein
MLNIFFKRSSSKTRLQQLKLSLLTVAMCLAAAAGAQGSDVACVAAGTLSTQTQVLVSQDGSISRSEVAFDATLFSRELISEPDSYWLGFQLIDTSIATEAGTTEPLFYSVPFAIQIDRMSGAWLSEIINAKLKAEDEDRLLAVYRTLHSLPSALVSPGETRIVAETDSVGSALTRYESPTQSQIIRSRERYQSYGNGQSEGLIESAIIEEDLAKISELECAMRVFDGRSKVQVNITGGMSFLTDQKTLLQPIKGATIPSDLRLATLNEDPRIWALMDIAAVYPPAKRQPLASSEQFLEMLVALDSGDVDTEKLRALLFDNDEFLLAIKEALGASTFSQDFEEELLLRIGQADSQRARQLLTALISDNLFTPKTRFGSIMALRYTNKKLEPEARDALLAFTLSNLSPSDQQLADSTLLILGSIAGDTQDGELESMLVDRLNSVGDKRRTMVTMTALANAGSKAGALALGDFLDSNSSALSARAAVSLGQIKSETAKQLLTDSLHRESRPEVLSSVIASLGESNLTATELVLLKTRTSPTEPLVVRRAAVQAISKQASHLPEAKAALKDLMIETTDRQSLEHIMTGLFGG